MREKLLFTICGRAGSKGFKNKNLKTFCGRPLAHYSVAVAEMFAQKMPNLEVDIVLNTDSEPLRELVCGAYPRVVHIERPAELAGDSVAKLEVFKQSLQVMESKKGFSYDYLMDLDITSPMRTLQDVVGCFEMLQAQQELELVMSGVKSRRNPYMNMAQRKEGAVGPVVQTKFVARQQTPQCYDLNASIYVFRRQFLAENASGMIWDARCDIYEMFDTGILDIDSEEDFLLLEVIAQHLYATMPQFAQVRDAI